MDGQRPFGRELEMWMVEKAKIASNAYDAESMLSTARLLFPTFEVEHAAFGIYCSRQNVSNAAASIQQMFIKFKSEPAFWSQAYRLVQAARSDPTTTDEATTFRRMVFNSLRPALQQTLLLELFEKQPDQEEKCQLVLLLIRLFPESSASFANMLLQLLEKYEKPFLDRSPSQVDNSFTSLLVNDVISLLLNNASSTVTELAAVRLLARAVSFFLCKIVQQTMADDTANSVPVEQFWKSILQYYTWIVKRWQWKTGSALVDLKFGKSMAFWRSVGSLPQGCAEAYAIALVCSASELFDLCQRLPSTCVVLQPGVLRNAKKNSFVEFKYDRSMLNKFANSFQDHDVANAFMACGHAVDVLYQCAEGVSKMEQLLNVEHVQAMVPMFTGIALLLGHTDEVGKALGTKMDQPRWSLLQSIGCQTIHKDHVAASMAITLLTNTKDLSAINGCAIPSSDHWHFRLLDLTEDVSYCVQVVARCLARRILKAGDQENVDEMIGHCLILMQVYWPTWKEVLDQFKLVWIENGRFEYALFFRYATDADLLESLAEFAVDQPTVEMVLGHVGKAAGKRSVGRHSNRALRGDAFRCHVEQQMTGKRPTLATSLQLFLNEQGESVKSYLVK